MLKIAICDDEDFICSQLEEILIRLEDIYLDKISRSGSSFAPALVPNSSILP